MDFRYSDLYIDHGAQDAFVKQVPEGCKDLVVQQFFNPKGKFLLETVFKGGILMT
jgi:hypothetical protein